MQLRTLVFSLSILGSALVAQGASASMYDQLNVQFEEAVKPDWQIMTTGEGEFEGLCFMQDDDIGFHFEGKFWTR